MNFIDCIKKFRRKYRAHAIERMFQRNINFNDIDEIIENLEVIEKYQDDYPFPSCLSLGYTRLGRPIHLVFSVDLKNKIIYVITLYEPKKDKWKNDFKRRRL